jgi:hypothetical protein
MGGPYKASDCPAQQLQSLATQSNTSHKGAIGACHRAQWGTLTFAELVIKNVEGSVGAEAITASGLAFAAFVVRVT